MSDPAAPPDPQADGPAPDPTDRDAAPDAADADDAPPTAPAAAGDDGELPTLPPTPHPTSAAELRAAVDEAPPAPTAAPAPPPAGAPPPSTTPPSTPPPGPAPRPRRRATTAEDADGPRPRRRWPLVLAGLGTVAAAIAALVVLGQVHSQRHRLRCRAKDIVAERGRSFPPWGFERLGGPAWKPIAIPPGAECTERETEDVAQLEGWFLEHLAEQAGAKLSGEAPGDVDRAEAELEQALLLARTPERRDLRKELERLRGDVTYWRAAAKVKAAAATLADAAKAFDDAAAQRPRHASDPARWATFVRSLGASLAAGPDGSGAPPPTPATPERPLAPPGVALPVEPPAAELGVDAGVEPDAARRDLPTGGVLM
jgi:hypothetical protein